MQLQNSQTYYNLARSFAGECQAGMRYQIMAKEAVKEKLYTLSDLIKNIAKNETVHAATFFNAIVENGAGTDNIKIEAGYPFRSGSLEEMLFFASEDERAEEERIYPEFAAVAREEGFLSAARAFEQISVIEGNHKIIFQYLYKALKTGTLYKSERATLWICSECGYMHTAKEAWNICPACKKEQGYVELHLPFDYMGRNGDMTESDVRKGVQI